MNLKEIVKGIPFRKEWQERYHYFIPLFMDNAIKFDDWEDWDHQIFTEFFEKNEGQCVSSLKQGCFTNEDKIKLKQNWKQFSPLLRELSLSQDEPNWDLYKRTSNFIRQYTSQNMQAATSRLIASLQPQFLCTVIAEDHLKVLYKKLNLGIADGSVPKYENGNWFKSSYNILIYFKEQLNDEDSYNIMTYPWQLKEEWMPTGYNKFYDILNEVKQIVDLNYPQFQIEDISPNVSNFLWIADSQDIIGNTTAHFEINKNRNKLSVDIHFEGTESKKNIFHQVIKQLPEEVAWKKWQNSLSLTYDEEYNITNENISEKLVNALVKLDKLIGDNIRNILQNIDILILQNQQKLKDMNNKIQLLEYKKQIILQGPPGTGKTKKAKEIALKMLGLDNIKELENNGQFKLIQFHPSYTYEDFVRGIVAKTNEDGEGILYEVENKILGRFAKEALKNYNENNNISSNDYVETWVDENFEDFKNEIEISLTDKEFTLSGEITVYRIQKNSFLYGKNWISGGHIRFEEFKKLVKAIIKGDISLGTSLLDKDKFVHSHYRSTYYNALLKKFFEKYHYTSKMINTSPKNYILVIDEINRANLSSVLGELIYAMEYRGSAVESMYEVDDSINNSKNHLILPPNLYIIGTMNTADRSVGHIDYAIRRRFAFVDVLPKNLASELRTDFQKDIFAEASMLFIKDYDLEVDYSVEDNRKNIKRSKHMSEEFDPKDVWLGHSYFIQHYEKDLEGNSDKTKLIDFKLRLDYEIKPILREYVKDGILKLTALNIIDDLGKENTSSERT